jgi:hypothetical protein
VSPSPSARRAGLAHRRAPGQFAADPHVEQFVEQQGMRGQAFAQQARCAPARRPTAQRHRLFVEQGEVTRAAQQHVQQAAASGAARHRDAAMRRAACSSAGSTRSSRARAHRTGCAPPARGEVAQLRSRSSPVFEAGRGQHRAIAGIGQVAPVRREVARRRWPPACRQQRVELGRDALALHRQRRQQACQSRIAQAVRDARARQRIRGQAWVCASPSICRRFSSVRRKR